MPLVLKLNKSMGSTSHFLFIRKYGGLEESKEEDGEAGEEVAALDFSKNFCYYKNTVKKYLCYLFSFLSSEDKASASLRSRGYFHL